MAIAEARRYLFHQFVVVSEDAKKPTERKEQKMKLAYWGEGAIIGPRYRRSAVLRALYEDFAGRREGERASAGESAAGGSAEIPREEGKEDACAGTPLSADVQRNI